jgi:hypothetical protein
MSNESTEKLMREFHPTTELQGDFTGYAAPISSQKFIETFGFKPAHLINRAEI